MRSASHCGGSASFGLLKVAVGSDQFVSGAGFVAVQSKGDGLSLLCVAEDGFFRIFVSGGGGRGRAAGFRGGRGTHCFRALRGEGSEVEVMMLVAAISVP